MKKFEKENLKDFEVVKIRCGIKLMKASGILAGTEGYLKMSEYKNNLKHRYNRDCDIVQVFKIKERVIGDISLAMKDENLVLVMEETKKEMTTEEMRKRLERLTEESIRHKTSRAEKIGTCYMHCVEWRKKHEDSCGTDCCLHESGECLFEEYDSTDLEKAYELVKTDGR